MKFGEKLRQLRLEKGFTQEEVASAVNVSRRTYIGYEQEGRYPKKRDLYSRLAQVLDTETSYLLTEDEEFVWQPWKTSSRKTRSRVIWNVCWWRVIRF